jgi:hypothetical protein
VDAKLLSYVVIGALVGSPYVWAYTRRRQGRPVSQAELRGAVRRTKHGIAGFSLMAAVVFLAIAALTGQLPHHPSAATIPPAASIGGSGR